MSDFTESKIAEFEQALIADFSQSTEENLHASEGWNQTAREYPREKCIHELFEEQAARTPDGVAVEFNGDFLTYQELDLRSNQLGHHLRSLGVGPDVLVGLCTERSVEMIIGLLAILKAGGAYVPLDPDYPKERLAYMMEDAEMPVLLTQRRIAGKIPWSSSRLVWLDEMEWTAHTTPLPNIATAESLAYVIYTSGSTGKPKGVEIPHRALVNCVWHFRDSLGVEADDVWLAVTTLSFDIAGLEIWLPLVSGASCAIVSRETAMDGELLSQALIDHEATILQATPVTWRMLILSGWEGNPKLQLLCGGEAMPQDLADRLSVLGAAAWNVYGPTETTIWSTAKQLRPNEVVTIGRPLANTQLYILDENRNPVLIAEEGDLFIGGDGVARGYRNRPELTSEKFVPDPFRAQPGARLYNTGDRARWLADGSVHLLGRADFQVKLRGYRIELGDIESGLRAQPAVREAVALIREDAVGEKELVAYLIASNGGMPSAAELSKSLRETLPDYMIPSCFLVVSELPLTPNGKVDRRALTTTPAVELDAGETYAAPQNPLESMLVEIWQQALRRQRIGIHDNFFHLGGHSLLAVMISAEIARCSNFRVPMRWILENPTIERLASRLGSCEDAADTDSSIKKADRREPLPMSFAQQGMWLLQQRQPEPATYNEVFEIRFSGRVDREKMREALQLIYASHEILHTALVQDSGELAQRIEGDLPLPWRELDLRSRPDELSEELIAEARRPFDLAKAPLWRATWIELREDEQVVVLNFHHSIVDEWTVRVFLREWERLYNSPAPEIRESPLQYADYAVWQRGFLTGWVQERQLDYWREQLEDLPPLLELPLERARPVRPSGRGMVHDFEIEGPIVSALRELAREEGTTLFTVFLTAFQVWLHRYTGQRDLVVVTPVAKRERAEIQSALGLFLNTLPIRLRVEGHPGFRQVLGQVRQLLLDGFSHGDLPFEQMVEMAVTDRTAAHPLYQVMFVLLEEGLPKLKMGNVEALPRTVATGTSKSELSLSVEAVQNGCSCRFEYSTDLFNAETVGRMSCHFAELLASLVENPDMSISKLNLMPMTEREKVLVEWNQTARPYPRENCIHELFEEQAARRKYAIALKLGEERMCYGELNRLADHVARHLRSLGVKPGNLVGLSVERSFERVIALLGVLKAGAVYWALEENLPAERLEFLIADAAPKIILTDRKTAGLIKFAALAVVHDLLASEPLRDVCEPWAVTAEDPAYVSYTSGSTGRPKGVVVSHRGVVRLVKGINYVSLGSSETLVHLSPLSFDASTFELWGALLNGGRVVIMPPGQPSLAEIGELVQRHRVTLLWLTTGLFHLMVDEQIESLKSLRQLLTGGEVISPKHVAKARRELPECRIYNFYGPTENTTFTSCYLIDDKLGPAEAVPIGRPITNTRVYILDELLQPVPIGVAGELYTGGDGVACGYLNQPELTDQRFARDPFLRVEGARMYRSGDRVRWRSDGNIEFLGRLDAQVKVRGFRVELGEIETALRSHPDVQEAVVLWRNDLPVHVLVAYVVFPEGRNSDPLEMRSYLREHLPDYMIPSAFVGLAELPLLPNGKLNRRRLPEPQFDSTTAESSQPKDLIELELIRIWQRLFQRQDIDRKDHFFELGGHSLLAAKVAAEIEKLLGNRLPIAALFQSPTIEMLAKRLTEEDWLPPWSSLVPLQPQGEKPPLFLVHGWGGDVYGFLDLAKLMGPDQPVYGIQAVGLDGSQPRHETMESMVAHYVAEIRSFQPDGPYSLGGYSLGGLIAYQVASHLHSIGENVRLLALFDSCPVGMVSWRIPQYVWQRCVYHLKRFWNMPNGRGYDYVRECLAALQSRSANDQSNLKWGANSQAPGSDYYHTLTSVHRLQSYPGTAAVFYCEDSDPEGIPAWRHLARGGVSFYGVPGTHHDIIKPGHVDGLASALRKAIDDVS